MRTRRGSEFNSKLLIYKALKELSASSSIGKMRALVVETSTAKLYGGRCALVDKVGWRLKKMSVRTVTLAEINNGGTAQFVDVLGDVFENSPWLVERAAAALPYASRDALVANLMDVMNNAAQDEQLALIRAHPDLAGKAARAGDLTDNSTREQASVGLDQLTDEEFDLFNRLNDDYQARFGIPFIIAVRDHTKGSILAAFETRLNNEPASEIAEAMRNIARIVSLRIVDTVME
jgi:2-oxo-4-hydroxy-4-carboxy-5-ureidoimidazoline decarboxylase